MGQSIHDCVDEPDADRVDERFARTKTRVQIVQIVLTCREPVHGIDGTHGDPYSTRPLFALGEKEENNIIYQSISSKRTKR
jgi:hypothetical protein